ncbi:Ig heavy chain V region 3 Precursor [Channa argus]|uniref:Ig heavy chain V region 3 n=1 Tax=Channa argus TaxID=215402 RepID=A0A6G1QF49_CHAAH|nr:Ig heavy chain V region 3 Precursor [Channa argus]
MTTQLLITFAVLCLWLQGVCLGVEVHQTPSALLRRPGDKVQLVCSHEKTDYVLMQWYQKSPGDQTLKRIGHVYYSNIEHEKSFQNHFNITGDLSGQTAKNGSLFIVDLKAPEHTAVYYCAASYAHRQHIPSTLHKNSETSLINSDGFDVEVDQTPPIQLGVFYL